VKQPWADLRLELLSEIRRCWISDEKRRVAKKVHLNDSYAVKAGALYVKKTDRNGD